MDCRITDCKVVLREDSIVSVPPHHFEEEGRTLRYFGIIKKMIQGDERARVLWCEDNTTSIEDVNILQLETFLPAQSAIAKDTEDHEKKKKFVLRIQPSTSAPDDIDLDIVSAVPDLDPVGTSTPSKCSSSIISLLY